MITTVKIIKQTPHIFCVLETSTYLEFLLGQTFDQLCLHILLKTLSSLI